MARTDITATNQWTPEKRVPCNGSYSVTITGTFSGKIQIQRRLTDDTTWAMVKEYTAAAEEDAISGGAFYYRLGSTDWTSGTASIAIVTRH